MEGLVLQGGGVLGAAEAGMLYQAFEQNYSWGQKPSDKWKIIAGTSIGSFNGLLIALGYTAREIYDFWFDIKNDSFIKKRRWRIWKSLYTRKPMENLIKKIITNKFDNATMDFKELYDLTGIDLICTGTVVQTGRPILFGRNHTNIAVATAVMMSTAFPVGFVPIETWDAILGRKIQIIDGGILMNLPILPLVKEGIDDITVLSVGSIDENYWIDGSLGSIKRILDLITISNELISLSWAVENCKKLKVYHAYCKGVDTFDWDKVPLLINEGINSFNNGPIDPYDIINNTININKIQKLIIKES